MRALFVSVVGITLIVPSVLWGAQKLGEYPAPRAPEVVYAKTCGYCHGRNVGPIILGRNLPADYVKTMARNGRNAMPAFRPTEVTNGELNGLANWISTSSTPTKEQGH
jgi:mono/diheme cytochrome c family protein